MRFLFDENLSPRLVALVASNFPGSTHVEQIGMRGATDVSVWDFAKGHGLTIVSKDNDFRQRAFLFGPPPKVIWLSVGNAGTDAIAHLIRSNIDAIQRFEADPGESLLVLELGQVSHQLQP